MSDGIAYQNKDILLKILSEAYKEKSFEHMVSIYLPSRRSCQPIFLESRLMRR